jgi:hypothetical protein
MKAKIIAETLNERSYQNSNIPMSYNAFDKDMDGQISVDEFSYFISTLLDMPLDEATIELEEFIRENPYIKDQIKGTPVHNKYSQAYSEFLNNFHLGEF